MWFFIALFIGGFLLTAFLTPKMKTENAKASTLDQFSFPRAKEGDPVPRFYGTALLNSPNTVSLSDFKADPIKKKVKTGLFSSKKVTTGYKYYSTVDLMFALGPGVIYRRLFFGKNQVWAGCLEACENVINIDLPDLYGGSEDGNRGGIGGQVAFYCGGFDQSQDSYLVAKLNAKVPAYVGMAHAVFRNFWWGNSASIDAVSVEASYFPDDLLRSEGGNHCLCRASNGLDANPICVLYDIITYGWGNLNYDPEKIDKEGWIEAAQKTFDEGNGISLVVSNAQEAKEAVKLILRQVNGLIFDNPVSGLVEIVLNRNDFEIADLPVFGKSQIKEVRNYTKKLWSETNNVVRLKYIDREDNYAEDKVAIAKDSSLLRFQGKERPVEVAMPGIKTSALANAIAARELANLNIPLFSCEMTINRNASTLKPGKPFVWVWPEYGIQQMVMRVRKIGLGSFEDNTITLSVVQDEFSVDATVIAAPAPSEYIPTVLVPVDISVSVVFELPAWLDYASGIGTRPGYTRLGAFVEAPSSYTNGYDAYVEDEGDDAQVLHLAPYSVHAKLVAGIDRFAGWDDGVVSEIVIKEISNPDLLDPGGSVRDGGGMIMIGDELFGYESFTDNGDETYTLNDVHRSLLDTAWLEHSANDKVYFFEGQEQFFEDDIPNGDSANVYFIDLTATGSSSVDDAVVSTVPTIGRVERVIAPDYVTLDGNRDKWQIITAGDLVTLDARPRNRLDTSSIWYENDAAGVAEDGTLYKIEWEVGGVKTTIADDETLPYDWDTTGVDEAVGVVLISAKKDTLLSYAAAPMPVVIGADWLMTDGEPILADGEGIKA